MQIDFEPDWDYLLEKACTFYERNPYVNVKTTYSWANYSDPNIVRFIGIDDLEIYQVRKQGLITHFSSSNIGITKLICTRFEWRWEYKGPRYFPVGSNACIEWNLRKQEGQITDLSKPSKIRAVQREEWWFCVYTEDTYEEILKKWEEKWNLKRTLDD